MKSKIPEVIVITGFIGIQRITEIEDLPYCGQRNS